MGVQPSGQMRIIGTGFVPALVGQRDHEGHGCIAQGQGRAARHGAGHVGHAIMHDPVDLVDRVLVGRGARCFETTALIDGDIDDHRAGLHRGQLCAADQLGCGRAGDQHGTDHHIGPRDQLGRGIRAGIARLEHPAIDIIEIAQPGQRAIKHRDIRTHARGDARGLCADDPAADHHHIGGADTRHATHQHTAPAIGLVQRPCADLRGQSARHLGHGRQKRQAAAGIGHGFIGDGGHTAGQEIARLVGVGGQMQIGEQDLSFAQPCTFDGLGFLDLYHHVGAREDRLRGGHDLGTCGKIGRVVKARAQPCAGFDDDIMAMRDGLAHGGRCQTDTKFLWFDFLGATDQHGKLLSSLP